MASLSRHSLPGALTRAAINATILSAQRERELLERYHATADELAMDELVRSHMPIILRAASRSAQHPGVDLNDLVQTATEGLLIAINRWSFTKSETAGSRFADAEADPAARGPRASESGITADFAAASAPRASRLVTYAMWWMRMLLTEKVVESRGIVARAKGNKTRRALFNLPKAIKVLNISSPIGSSDVTRIAVYLGFDERDVEEALAHAAGDVMLDEPVGESGTLRGDSVADGRTESEDQILTRLTNDSRWNAVCEALIELPPRVRFILVARYLLQPKWKMDALSGVLKMSSERIRQISDRGLATIRRSLAANSGNARPDSERAARAVEALVRAIETAGPTPEMLGTSEQATCIPVGAPTIVGRPSRKGLCPSKRSTHPAIQGHQILFETVALAA